MRAYLLCDFVHQCFMHAGAYMYVYSFLYFGSCMYIHMSTCICVCWFKYFYLYVLRKVHAYVWLCACMFSFCCIYYSENAYFVFAYCCVNACKCVDLGAYVIICLSMNEVVCVVEVGCAVVHVLVCVLQLEKLFVYIVEAYFSHNYKCTYAC